MKKYLRLVKFVIVRIVNNHDNHHPSPNYITGIDNFYTNIIQPFRDTLDSVFLP